MNRMFGTPDQGVFQGQANDNFELAKAWAGTTLAYAIVLTGSSNLLSRAFAISLILSGIVCGMGLILHELAHRVVARSYGAQAHFVANNGFLLISILIAFGGAFIAAPGAVWHRGQLTQRQGGLIALAGPVTNLVFALLFLIALPIAAMLGLATAGMSVAGVNLYVLLFFLCQVGYSLNSFIGVFNMIPAGPFDGAKVLAWSPLVFGITAVLGVLLTFFVKATTVWSLLGTPVPGFY